MQGGEHWCALGVSASAVFAQNGGVGWLVALVCTGQALQGASAVFAQNVLMRRVGCTGGRVQVIGFLRRTQSIISQLADR